MRHRRAIIPPQGRARPTDRLCRDFWRRDDGSMTVFATIIFVLMVGIGGIAIDLMRFETQRVQLQSTLDRAVLAAAAISQPLSPRSVVDNYLQTAGLEGYRLRVTVDENASYRRVTARAEMDLPTFFMNMFGQPVLTAQANGAAEERVTNIEVSMVLDISGSMDVGNRMVNLRPAARNFVSTILAPNNTPTGDKRVSVSLVPYDHAVNIGPALASVFSLSDEHSYSTCVRFFTNDFTFSGIDPTVPLQRMGHFDVANSVTDPVQRPACRRGTSGAIIPWAHDEAALHTAIDNLSPFGFTASDQGMRWAVALLDPTARPALAGLISNGTVHSDFAGRPATFSDPDTIKIVVLMTDGENTRQFDLQDNFRTGPSPFWRDNDDGDFSVFYSEWNMFWQEDNDRWSVNPDGGPNTNAVQLDYSDLWNHISVQQLRARMFHPDAWERHEGQPSSTNLWRRATIEAMQARYDYADVVNDYSADNGIVGDERLRAICDVAHAQDIVVFAIAFEAPERGQQLMRYCASSDAHYYDSAGLNIQDAFASIASTIADLRLVR